jgi:pre-mRNA-processing factor 6
LGRGATGFTTQSDIGPARETSDTQKQFEQTPAEADERFQDPDNEVALFAGGTYEADDEEADKIWEAVDLKMDERRKSRREAREREELEKLTQERPKIQQQFSDLKRSLASVTEAEWENLPESMDNTRRKGAKNERLKERFVPVPDSILMNAQASGQMDSTIESTDGTMTDFVQFGQARGQVLGVKLDQASDSSSGSTNIDPKGYLTDLGSLQIKTDADISDYKKARTLLRSVITTNPKHAPGWIAAARLEEHMGKNGAAREVIAKGCEQCPKSDDVWLEAARLNTPENAKIILANAAQYVPESVRIWIKAMDLEGDVRAKKRVIRSALEFIPNSVSLWKTAISLEEDSEDARIMLSRAVECVPMSTELWLALARLEKYENAKKVLNRARAAIPSSHEIWITAAKLEETQDNDKMVDVIIQRAVQSLSVKNNILDREGWLEQAEACEADGNVCTAQAIVRHAVGLDLDQDDQRRTWIEDAQRAAGHKSIHVARATYAHALKTYPNKKDLWLKAAFLEKAHGSIESLEELLKRAVTYVPQAETLWLMAAKEKWLGGDVDGARTILSEAFIANPDSENIWLAAVKLESENGEHQRARALLTRAREKASTRRVWMKSAVFERSQGNFKGALDILDDALEKYSDFDKLWMIKGQILAHDMQDLTMARQVYAKATKACSKSIPLWIQAARVEEAANVLIKGRAMLERARLLNPKTPELWLEAILLEERGGNQAMAKAMMSKALQECPDSGLLWSEAILMEPRPLRKSKSADALKKTENDAKVVCVIARLFWQERKTEKARTWFQRVCKTDPDWGDGWAWWYRFELQQGTHEQQEEVLQACVAAEPKYGALWASIAKDLKNAGKKKADVLKMVALKCDPLET